MTVAVDREALQIAPLAVGLLAHDDVERTLAAP